MKLHETAVAVLAAFALYLAGALPFVYWADSGELSTGAYVLGNAHPPSFPVYAMLVKGMTLLPLGNIAFKVSLASGLFAAFAMGMLYHWGSSLARAHSLPPDTPPRRNVGTTNILTRSIDHAVDPSERCTRNARQDSRADSLFCLPAASIAITVFALTPAAWLSSVRQEIYTLHLALALGIVVLLQMWAGSRRPSLLYFAGFLFGLGLGNHSLLTLALFPPILAYLLLIDWRQVLDLRTLTRCLAAFALGASSYLYLPIRSAVDPVMDWNDPQYLNGFLESFTKRGEMNLFVGKSGYLEHLEGIITALVSNFSPYLILFLPFGILPFFARRAAAGVLTVGLLVTNLATVVISPTYSPTNPDIPGYLLLTYAIFALWIGEGIQRTSLLLLKFLKPTFHPLATIGLTAACAGVIWVGSEPRYPNAADDRARQYALLHLATAPPGALILTKSDPATFTTMFMQTVEGWRPDVLVINRKGLLSTAYITNLEHIDPGFKAGRSSRDLRQQGLFEEQDFKALAASSYDGHLAREVADVLAVSLLKRPVLWEAGSDNRWLMPWTRPSGLLLQIEKHPVVLTREDHQRIMAFQERFLSIMTQENGFGDPRAGRAAEVVLFNLANALSRENSAPPAWIASSFGRLWQLRPELEVAGLRYAEYLLVDGDFSAAEHACRHLVATSANDASVWLVLGRALWHQERKEESMEVLKEGLRRHTGSTELEAGLNMLRQGQRP